MWRGQFGKEGRVLRFKVHDLPVSAKAPQSAKVFRISLTVPPTDLLL